MEPLETHNLIACPVCDTLHRDADIPMGSKARCRRCHATLVAPKSHAMTRILMFALTSLILMVAAISFPFLDVSASGLEHQSSVIDAILAFAVGPLIPLAFAVAVLIIVLPTFQLLSLVYVLGPMAIGYRPWPYAKTVFRIAQSLRPWSMAEIFVMGVAVALVKIAGLATLTLGPAFWAFVGLVVVIALKDAFMCETSVWKTLEQRSPR